MKNKVMLVAGVLGILVVFGVAAALAQNTGDEKTKNIENQCTPEIMENAPENCSGQMMQSEACENMMNATNQSSMQAGCSEMMGNNKSAGNNETAEADHCGGMDSGVGSVMGSSTSKAAL